MSRVRQPHNLLTETELSKKKKNLCCCVRHYDISVVKFEILNQREAIDIENREKQE